MALNEVVRMYDDLEKALKKPAEQRSWGMLIDCRKCVGCQSCAVACMAENVCPPGTSYRAVFEAEDQGYPKLDIYYMPANCLHCDNAPCLKAANKFEKDAVIKRKDGIIEFDYAKLVKNPRAATAAKKACPYFAIVEDKGGFHTEDTPVFEAYETRDFYEHGKKLTRKKNALKGAIRICTFCSHRLDNGMIPACVSTCIGRAMYFGDMNDPGSLLSELLKKEKTWRYEPVKDAKPNEPRVYYIGYENRVIIGTSSLKTCIECHK